MALRVLPWPSENSQAQRHDSLYIQEATDIRGSIRYRKGVDFQWLNHFCTITDIKEWFQGKLSTHPNFFFALHAYLKSIDNFQSFNDFSFF